MHPSDGDSPSGHEGGALAAPTSTSYLDGGDAYAHSRASSESASSSSQAGPIASSSTTKLAVPSGSQHHHSASAGSSSSAEAATRALKEASIGARKQNVVRGLPSSWSRSSLAVPCLPPRPASSSVCLCIRACFAPPCLTVTCLTRTGELADDSVTELTGNKRYPGLGRLSLTRRLPSLPHSYARRRVILPLMTLSSRCLPAFTLFEFQACDNCRSRKVKCTRTNGTEKVCSSSLSCHPLSASLFLFPSSSRHTSHLSFPPRACAPFCRPGDL